jgi:hypothetical protein
MPALYGGMLATEANRGERIDFREIPCSGPKPGINSLLSRIKFPAPLRRVFRRLISQIAELTDVFETINTGKRPISRENSLLIPC